MKKFSVSAFVNIAVEFIVEADSEEEAYVIADNVHYSIEQWDQNITEFKSCEYYSNNIQTEKLN
jgi:hypothetical protein